MFAVLRKCRKLYLPVDIQLQLFDSIVVPVLLYASDVSGFESCDILERLCIQFYKIILRAKKTTPNTILYGELGKYPISIAVKSRMIGFWQKLINGKSDKISYKLYKILLALHEKDIFHSKWLLSIRNTLHKSDKDLTWLSQVAHVNIAKVVKTKLIENYKEVWKMSVFESPKCLNYRIFKQAFHFENYFSILPSDLALPFFHFRSLNHKFPIEWGRYLGIERDDRVCELCRLHRLGDEYHYVLECTYFDDLREKYLPRDLFTAPNTVKLQKVMSSGENDTELLFKIAKYCKVVLKTFREIFLNIP